MSKTFLFEELDDATREYLTAVRDNEGVGAPGVFAATSDSLPGCGCIAGPIALVATFLLTIPTWTGIIFQDPVRVAVLQTAGFMVGGWLFLAKFRAMGGRKNAGTWVYVDPLFLYEAFREQVTVTAIDEVADARYTHNYDSNGNYQNSVVVILLGGRKSAAVTLAHEARAEQMVTFLNYVAWARGPDGGERADLGAADLGGLAKYVVRNGDEPKDAQESINLNLVELDITEVPEGPTREGRAIPAFLPYLFIFAGCFLCFCVMAFLINPVVRDEAIFERVTKDPQREQPGALRAYLIDPRNTMHRKEVLDRLPRFYVDPVKHIESNIAAKTADPQLGRGMCEILRLLGTAEQPVVSLRVTETLSPPRDTEEEKEEKEEKKKKLTREGKLRNEFADGVNTAFANEPWGRQVPPPPGYTWGSPTDPPPIGHQLIAFVEGPEEKPVHFDIAYAVKPVVGGQFQIVVNVTLKADVAKDEVGRAQFTVPGTFTADDLKTGGTALVKVKDELIKQMIGPNTAVPLPGPQFPQFP